MNLEGGGGGGRKGGSCGCCFLLLVVVIVDLGLGSWCVVLYSTIYTRETESRAERRRLVLLLLFVVDDVVCCCGCFYIYFNPYTESESYHFRHHSWGRSSSESHKTPFEKPKTTVTSQQRAVLSKVF
jgi:hypothetical protein